MTHRMGDSKAYADERQGPSEHQLAKMAEHVVYEHRMCKWAAGEVDRHDPGGLHNALVEAYLLHARVLTEFFRSSPGGDDVVAHHYVKDWNGGPDITEAEQVIRAINKRMAHLTLYRLDHGSLPGDQIRWKPVLAHARADLGAIPLRVGPQPESLVRRRPFGDRGKIGQSALDLTSVRAGPRSMAHWNSLTLWNDPFLPPTRRTALTLSDSRRLIPKPAGARSPSFRCRTTPSSESPLVTSCMTSGVRSTTSPTPSLMHLVSPRPLGTSFQSSSAPRSTQGRLGTSNPKGCLQGIVHGIGLIEQLQPYHRRPDPRDDSLWHVHRFNNADKHRHKVKTVPIPQWEQSIFVSMGLGSRHMLSPEFPKNWTTGDEAVIHRVRFDPPWLTTSVPWQDRLLSLEFGVPPFDGEPVHTVHKKLLRKTCDDVAIIVDLFEKL